MYDYLSSEDYSHAEYDAIDNGTASDAELERYYEEYRAHVAEEDAAAALLAILEDEAACKALELEKFHSPELFDF